MENKNDQAFSDVYFSFSQSNQIGIPFRREFLYRRSSSVLYEYLYIYIVNIRV